MFLRKAAPFDVCVIGSGPAGSWVTKTLTEAGASVVLLEGGREVPPHEFAGHKWPYQFPRRGTWEERQRHFYPDDIERHIRYDGDRVSVDRIRVLGGRSTHWNGVTLRFSRDDFRDGATHGLEPDWPLSYDDLAPFYAEVERTIGVVGTREGLDVLPDGEFYAPSLRLRCSENIARKTCHRMGIPMIPTRKALLVGQPRGTRLPCHYCRHCMDGCEVGAIANAVNTMLPAAHATGRLTLRTNALVRRIETDGNGRASDVVYVDRQTGRDSSVRASLVVVSCGAVESARLLLNSTSTRFPNGLANSSGLVGCYLTGHTLLNMYGYLDALVARESVNQDGATDHATIPRFTQLRGKREYAGGFFAQVMFAAPDYPHHATRVAGFGPAFKQRVRELQPAMLQLGAFGKVLSRRENCVTVDPNRLDRHGIPVPVVRFSFCDNDRALWSDMAVAFQEIYDEAGTALFFRDQQTSGFASHEVGTCRMGTDPKTSVLTPFCQSHDVPNLFVVDGSCFVTFAEKNPTLTIMALALRAATHMAAARKRGDL
jgi:choline dehydrogenase-like flavoprotein